MTISRLLTERTYSNVNPRENVPVPLAATRRNWTPAKFVFGKEGGQDSGAGMRLSRERLLLRKGVIDGVGRVARVMYEPETIEPLPESLAQLLARLNALRSWDAPRKVGRSNTSRYGRR